MRLTTRLWLLGAILPSLLTLTALVAAGLLFRLDLVRALDRALLAQAAIESVSLFDGPGRRPHLHMAVSPLVEQVRPFAPSGALHGPDGRLVMRYPPPRTPAEAAAVPPLLPGPPGAPPRLETGREHDGSRARALTVTVASPDGQPYTLRLSASLAQVDASMRVFEWVTLLLAALFCVLLLGLQIWQARRLSGRVLQLVRHMTALREGQLDRAPPSDDGRDEIGQLRAVVVEATGKLRAAREAQERLIADAAHELRTPLTLMRTSIDLALRRDRGAAELREALGDARREVDRLAALAGSLLDLAAVGRGAWDRTIGDLREVAAEAALAARAEAEARGLLVRLDEEDGAGGAAPALFHAGALRQAIDNLIGNALKFSPPGGVIAVAVERRAAAYRVVVRDEGPGIAAADRELVFSPFRRAGGQRSGAAGAGLGLAIVREIARRHGGDAYAAGPRSARGAELVIELPAAPGGALAGPPRPGR